MLWCLSSTVLVDSVLLQVFEPYVNVPAFIIKELANKSSYFQLKKLEKVKN